MEWQRRQFSPEFKTDLAALVQSTGRPIAAIAHELGISGRTLAIG
jgi:transposase-like protein